MGRKGSSTKIKTDCSFCNSEIFVIPSYIEKFKNHFCNRKCHQEYQKIHPLKYWLGKKIQKEHFNKFNKARKKYQENNKLYNEIDLSSKRVMIEEMYKKGYSIIEIGNILGVSANTINRRLDKWSIQKRNHYTMNSRFEADDGHLVRSGMELFADNWLFHNGIIHVYEKYLGETKFRCDFYISETNTYIEIFGLNKKEYKLAMLKKIKLYRELGLINNLIMIFPKEKIEDKLKFLLSVSKIQRGIEDYEK